MFENIGRENWSSSRNLTLGFLISQSLSLVLVSALALSFQPPNQMQFNRREKSSDVAQRKFFLKC